MDRSDDVFVAGVQVCDEMRAGLDRNRTELLRWSFGLWTGQVVVVLAILAFVR